MILSSADILGILRGSQVIRLLCSLQIVDSKPTLTGSERVLIYIDRFPSVEDFEATWLLWIEGEDDLDLVLAEMQKILPLVEVERGLMTVVQTTSLRSANTQEAPREQAPIQIVADFSDFDKRFQALEEGGQEAARATEAMVKLCVCLLNKNLVFRTKKLRNMKPL